MLARTTKKFTLENYSRRHLVHITYWLGFLIAFHGYLLIYINAPFLAEFTSEQNVGLIYAAMSFLSVLSFIVAPALLSRIGNFRATLLAALFELVAVIGLAFSGSFLFVVLFFVVHAVVIRLLGFGADIFLESGSENNETGSIRGVFLTFTNVALVFSPIAVGFILGNTTDYWKVYAVSAIVLIPIFSFLITQFRSFKDPEYHHVPFFRTLKATWLRKNVYKILASNVVLRIFYAVMVIYTPIFMHDFVGFEWEQIGIMFTIMLLPYALFEYPLGVIADKWLGEKEILSMGFVIMATATAFITFINSNSFIVWTLVLLITRIGASAIEIMNETYFFKHVDKEDSDIISLFRMVQPVPYIFAPLIGSVVLLFLDFKFIFLVIGIIMLWGLRYSLTLKDTR